MTDSPSGPGPFLARLSRRLRTRLFLEALLRLLSAGAVWFLPAFWLHALGLSAGTGRSVFYVGFLASALWLYAKYVRIPRRIYARSADLARLAESVRPELRDRLVSATEFAADLEQDPPYSRRMAQAAIDALSENLRAGSARTIVPLSALRPVALRTFAAFLPLFAVLFLAPESVGSFWGGNGSSAEANGLDFLAGDIHLTYHYPEYTGLEALRVPNSSGDIEAPPGTRVALEVRASRDFDRAVLDLEEGSDVELEKGEGRTFSGEITVTSEDHYRFSFDGESDKLRRSLRIKPDREPFAAVDYPPTELEVRETDRIELSYRLEDDYGLKSAELVFDYDNGKKREERRIPLKSFEDRSRSFRGETVWDLSATLFKEGDRVPYFVEVKDNDSVNGPKIGRSETHTLKIFSVQEHHKKLIELQEKYWESMIALLAKRLEHPVPENIRESPDAITGIFTSHIAELNEILVDPLGRLTKELEDDPLATEAIRSLMTAMLDDWSMHRLDYENSLWKFERDLQAWRSDGRGGASLGVFYKLKMLAEGSIQRLEKYIIDLYELLQKQKYDALVGDTEKLSDIRDELRRLLEEYKRTGDEALAERIRALLDEMRKRLSDLYAKMADVKKETNNEFINPEALHPQEMKTNMDGLDQALKSGDLDKAFQELENLSMMLNDTLEQMKKGSEELGESLYSESMRKLLDFQKDLDQLTEKQKEIQKVTEERKQTLQERMAGKMERDLDRNLAEMERKVQEAIREAGAVKQPPSQSTQQNRDVAVGRMEELKKALENRDVSGARDIAELALGRLQALSSELKNPFLIPPGGKKNGNAENIRHAETAEKRLQEVTEELRQAMPDPGKFMNPEEKRQLQEMARRQRQLEQESYRLRQDVAELEKEVPFMPPDAQNLMQSASAGMQQSRQKLDEMRPGQAEGHQRQSIHNMEQLKEGIGEAMKQMQSGMKYGGMQPSMKEGSGRTLKREKVALPKPGEHRSPKELREDLLEAMKRKSPEYYEPQNRQYYKELVK